MANVKAKIVGDPLPGPNLLKPADVIAIPLSDGCWAYARILNGAQMQVLNRVSSQIESIEKVKEMNTLLFVEYYEPYDKSPWVYVGKWDFDDNEDSWGPPTYIRDIIDPSQLRILSKGKMLRNCTENDIKGLSKHGLSTPREIELMILDNRKAGKC